MEVSKEYIKRLLASWTSNISVPQNTRAANTSALSLLGYITLCDSQLEDQ